MAEVAFRCRSVLMLPAFAGEGRVGLRENYYGHQRWFFGMLAASLLKDLFLIGHMSELGAIPPPSAVAALTRSDGD